MIVGIRVWLQSRHCEGSILGSNVDDTSEQTRGRKTEPIVRGRGRKDKSHDVVVNIEARASQNGASHGGLSGGVGLD